jgi:hypothetical protein
MANIEYSDYYKFRVSLGLVLLGLSPLLPWLFFREPFDLLITTDTLKTLTPDAQKFIAYRQATLLGSKWLVFAFSSASFLSGLAFLTTGLVAWKKKQLRLDEHEIVTYTITQKELEEMSRPESPSEKLQRTISEVQASNRDAVPDSQVQTDTQLLASVTKYAEVEEKVSKKLLEYFGDEYFVLSNRTINGAQFDNILQKKDGRPPDLIVETMYANSGFDLRVVQNRIKQLWDSSEIYFTSTKREVIGVVFLVSPKAKRNEKMFSRIEESVREEQKRHQSVITIQFVSEEEIDSLNLNDFRQDMSVTRQLVNSANLHSVDYNPKHQVLDIQFKQGGVYRYYNVPVNVYEDLMRAYSKGAYLATHVKNVYRYTKVE